MTIQPVKATSYQQPVYAEVVHYVQVALTWHSLYGSALMWGPLYVLTLSEGFMTEDEYGSFSEEDYENEYRYAHGC